MKIKLLILSVISIATISVSGLQASGLLLDATIGDVIGENPAAQVLGVRWGFYSDGVFTQAASGISVSNTGYLDIAFDELSTSLSATSNSGNVATPGAQLSLALYYSGSIDSSDFNWSGSITNYAILQDSTWTVPTFSLNPALTAITFTGSTQALVGSISNPSTVGATSITLVPEPSTYALMALGGLVLFFVVRRRKVQA
jgi:hypothetical protein